MIASWRERLAIPAEPGYQPHGANEIEVRGDLLGERRRRFLRAMREYHEAQHAMHEAEQRFIAAETAEGEVTT